MEKRAMIALALCALLLPAPFAATQGSGPVDTVYSIEPLLKLTCELDTSIHASLDSCRAMELGWLTLFPDSVFSSVALVTVQDGIKSITNVHGRTLSAAAAAKQLSSGTLWFFPDILLPKILAHGSPSKDSIDQAICGESVRILCPAKGCSCRLIRPNKVKGFINELANDPNPEPGETQ